MFKFFNLYFRNRWERFYLKNRWHLLFDLALLVIIITLGISVVSLYFYRPALNWSTNSPLRPAVDLNNPPLKLELTSAASSLKIAAGVILKINYQNNGSEPITKVKLNLATSDKNYTLARLEKVGINPEIEIKGTEITFPLIKSGASGEVPVRVYFSLSNPEAERQINWQATSEYFLAGQLFTATWNLASLKIASELTVTSAAYYTSPQGDQLGVGPLPPIVGLPTNYWIFIEAKSRGDFKNFVFSARLPAGVELTANRSLLAGDFKYTAATRQIIWKVPEIKNQDDNYRLGFEVQLTPAAEQVGKTPNLLINSGYFARDSVTAGEVNGELNSLSANLDFDRFNRGQGEVSAK